MDDAFLQRDILGSVKVSLHLFNALHILAGLTIVSFGCYLQIDFGTYVVTIVSLALGGYILILGCLGLIAVRFQNWCLLTVSTALQMALSLSLHLCLSH